jgi:transposase
MRPSLNIQRDQFISLYNKGYRYTEIAAHFDICEASVYKLRKQYGLPMRRKPFYTVDEKEFRRLYNEDVLLQDIAKQLKISRSYVYEIRKRLGLLYRNTGWEKKGCRR